MNWPKTPRDYVTTAAVLLGTVFVVPIMQGGVGKWSERRGYDQVVSSQLDGLVAMIASITESGPFLFALAAVTGGAWFLWADYFFRHWAESIRATTRPLSIKNVDRRLVAMTLMFIFATGLALSAGWFVYERRGASSNANTAVKSIGSSPPQPTEVALTTAETRIKLQFGGSNEIPVGIELHNIWRWYALSNVVILNLPEGQREIKTWSVFLTFDKPVDVKQVLVSVPGNRRYEVKDTSPRSAVIAFLEDIVNAPVEIRVVTSVGTPANGPATPPSPPPKPHYDSAEISAMLGVLRKWTGIIDQKIEPGHALFQNEFHLWDQKLKTANLQQKVEAAEKARRLLSDGYADLRKTLQDERYFGDQLAPVINQKPDVLSSVDSALKDTISDLQDLNKYPGIDIVKYIRPKMNRAEALVGGLPSWMENTRVAIRNKTKELREWKNP